MRIAKGVKIPRAKGPKYPWSRLKVGDSFFVSNPPKQFPDQVYRNARKRGRTFIYRNVRGGIRVWRTK